MVRAAAGSTVVLRRSVAVCRFPIVAVSESTAIVITLVIYKVALVVIGVLASRQTTDASDFFLGGRKLGAFVAALSASASSSSAWTLLGVSGAAYAWGISAVWIAPACVGGFALNWYVLAPRLRRVSARESSLTVTEALAGPIGAPRARAIRVVASVIVLVSLLTYVASQFQGAGKTFAETFAMSMPSAVLLGAAIVVLYTILGGFWAVSVTDSLQGMVMVIAAVALPLGALSAVGGVGPLLDGLGAVDKPHYDDLYRGMSGPAAAGFVVGVLGIGLGYPGQPHVANRFMALRDDEAVRRGRQIAMVWATVMYASMLVVGWSARVLLPELADPEVAFISTTRMVFPPVVAGVMIAAVLSAVMSTADSQLLVAASAVAHDLFPATAQQRVLNRSRVVVLALSVLAVAAALWGSQEIFSRVLFAWSAMGNAFGPLLLVLVVRGPVLPNWRLASIVAGFGLSVAAYWHPDGSGTAWERVFPFVVALALAAWGARRDAQAP